MTNKELTLAHLEYIKKDGVFELSKRFTMKMFREELNRESGQRPEDGGKSWRNNVFGNRKRAYGDYLFRQDRDMFMDNYRRWLLSKVATK